MEKYYTFTMTVGGMGETPEEAWDDAMEALQIGTPPLL